MEDNTSISSDGETVAVNLFEEPSDFYSPKKPDTFTEYSLQDGRRIPLKLVGHSPLWGHLVWNAGRLIAKYLEDNVDDVKNKTVLELGAGAGLPSLTAAALGARKVVVTDYPEAELIDNLRFNVEQCSTLWKAGAVEVMAFLWGNPVEPLCACLGPAGSRFELLILADILFNHSEHRKLVSSVRATLKKDLHSKALVFFTPYRPWLLEKDLNFFDLAKAGGLAVKKLFEHTMDSVMFENDPGDEELRRTVFAFEVTWPSPADG